MTTQKDIKTELAKAPALEGTLITKDETALLKAVNDAIEEACSIVQQTRKVGVTLQASLQKLAEGKRTVDEMVAMFASLPAIQRLAQTAPKKPAKEAPEADHLRYEEERADRRQLDNVVRGMLRGFKHDNFKFAWSAGSVAVMPKIAIVGPATGEPLPAVVNDLDESDTPACDALMDGEPDASGEEVEPLPLGAPVEPAAITARGSNDAPDPSVNEVVEAIRGAKEKPSKLADESDIVQLIVAMPRKQRLALCAIVNEHSNLEVQGTFRIG